jgi:hypothetical protein
MEGSGEAVFCLFLRSWFGSTSSETSAGMFALPELASLVFCVVGGRVNLSRDAWFLV